jgi:hypothetical protein
MNKSLNHEPTQTVDRQQLRPGDEINVITKSSLYQVRVLREDIFVVSGGWFDENRESPQRTRILGCSMDAKTINEDIVCAFGLHVHFDNGVVTSPVHKIELKRHQDRQNL